MIMKIGNYEAGILTVRLGKVGIVYRETQIDWNRKKREEV
jgi:hypothetical protein